MYSILLVDDSATDRRLLEGLLSKKLHFHVETADDGAVAIQKLERQAPDLVVTDMQMPNMDGLELVEAIRSRNPWIPVILITAEGSEELAARALQRGAAGYVPKTKCDEMLSDTIEHVLDLARTESSFERIIDCATLSQFEISFENDFALVAPVLELAQRMTVAMGVCDPTSAVQVSVALEHAILNAIYHGNLELDGTIEGNRELRNQRMSESPYKDRRVHVSIKITPAEAVFSVRDEGSGFNVREAAELGRQIALTGGTGQGLFLMWAFMDDVKFTSPGNSVIMTKRRSEEAQRAKARQETNDVEVEQKLPEVMGTLTPKDGGPSAKLTKTRLTIGRDTSCDVVVRSPSISQHHCLLYLYQGWWYVRDLKSKNGIKVNHLPCHEHVLRPEYTLSVGKYDYVIHYEPFQLGAVGIEPPPDPF